MKFIHLSDTRIGNSAESGTPWEQARLIELEGGLSRVMTEAELTDVDLVIISGGLFAGRPSTAELENLSVLFSSYPGIQVVIIAGETDSIGKSSPINSFEWPQNVHYALGGNASRIVLPGIRTEIFASSITDYEMSIPAQTALAMLQSYTDPQPIRIAVLRSDKTEDVVEAFGGVKVSYVALGSSVSSKQIPAANIACPGFFEPGAMGDKGQHGVFVGTISETDGKLEALDFKPMAEVSYISLLIRTSIQTGSAEVESLVRGEIERRGVKNIYRLKITGPRDPEVHFDLSDLQNTYRIADVIDETEPEYNYRELFAEHPQDMIGFYIAKILNDKRDMSPVEKKAMYYGLDALLNTTRE